MPNRDNCMLSACRSAAGSVERQLEGLELLYFLHDRRFPVNICMILQIESAVSSADIERGLNRIQDRCWQLRTQVDVLARTFRIVENCRPVPLRILSNCSEADLVKVIEAELSARVPVSEAPLARCALLNHAMGMQSIVITFNHCLFDGASAKELSLALLSALRNGASHGEAVSRKISESCSAYFPEKFRGRAGIGKALLCGLRQIVDGAIIGRPQESALTCGHQSDWKPKVILTNFCKIDELRLKAREKGLTVHALLCAAQLMATARLVGSRKLIAISTAVNLRPKLMMSESEVGAFFSAILTRHRIAGDECIWQLAVDVRRCLANSLKQEEHFYNALLVSLFMGVLGLLPRGIHASGLSAVSSRFVPPHTTISNIGAVDPAVADGQLQAAFFVVGGPADWQIGSTATSLDGKLYWNFIYNCCSVDDRLALRFADLAGEILASCLDTL